MTVARFLPAMPLFKHPRSDAGGRLYILHRRHCRTAPLPHPDAASAHAPPRAFASAPRLLYVVSEDWYFLSHRLPMARAARDAGFDVHVATNVRGPYFLIQAALPDLLASPIRSVVNISSSSGTMHLAGQSVYGMTKAALNYLTMSLAGELAPSGVRVNCIGPGPIDTPIHQTWADDLEAAYRWLADQVPLGRIGVADEVARWITFLLSPLSSFMTGAVIPLDGGQVIHRV